MAIRGKSFFVLASIALALILVSCGSPIVVRTRTLTPAEVDMSSMRNVAIASTDFYAGGFQGSSVRFTGGGDYFAMSPYSYSSGISVDLSKHFNDKFITDIQSTGYFTKLIVPPDSDMLAKPGAGESLGLSRSELAARNGIRAVINTAVTEMSVDEYVETKPVYDYKSVKNSSGRTVTTKKLIRYDYLLHQSVKIEVQMRVVSAADNRTIAVKKASDSYSTSKYVTYGLRHSDSLEDKFNEMLDNISIKLANMLIPHYVYRDVEMMENNPKLDGVSPAYGYVENGGYAQAYELFKYGWDAYKHVPSGYNAALLLHARGLLDEAVDLAQEVQRESGSPAIMPLLGELKAMQSIEKKAMEQL